MHGWSVELDSDWTVGDIRAGASTSFRATAMTLTILIPTEVGDAHALAVELALEAQGHTAVRWFGADYPQRQSSSFTFSGYAPMEWRAAVRR